MKMQILFLDYFVCRPKICKLLQIIKYIRLIASQITGVYGASCMLNKAFTFGKVYLFGL